MKSKYLILSCLMIVSRAIFAQSETALQEASADTIVRQDLAKNAEWFSKGLEAKYSENYTLAIANFEQALKFFNNDDASMYELAGLYQMEERNIEALSMIQKAANLQPDNKWYQIKLAELYLQNYDYQAFMNIYDELLKNEPENLDYLETYIDMLLRIGEFNKVIEKLDVVEKQLGKNEYIYLQRIQIYDEQGKKDKAIEEMEKLVEFEPENTQFRALLAEAYRKKKRDKDAYQQYLKIKELEPDNKYINVSLMDYYQSTGEFEKAFNEFIAVIKNKNLDYDTKVQIHELWSEQNEKSKDAHKIQRAVDVGQAFIQTYPDKSIGYYIMGVACSNMNDYKQAQTYFQNSMEKDKSNFATLYQLCVVDINLNDYQKTLEHAQAAISLYPEQPLFYLFSGIAYFNLKDYENTITALEKGRKRSANKELTADFDTYIGDTYNLLNNKQKSYEAYDRVLKTNPDNIYVLNNYAYYLSLDNRDLERALQMSEKTIKAEPRNPTYLDTYAWILYKMGRYQEAKKYMDKVFKYDKKPQGVNYEHLGDILYQMGDVKNAVKNWKKAQKLGGVSEFIDQKIKDEKLYE